MTQRKGQALPQEMGHSQGQGMPQRMGTPYYLSLLPTPYSPSAFTHHPLLGTEAVTREAAPEQRVDSETSWMEEIDFEAEVPCAIRGHDHPADILVTTQHCKPPQTAGCCWFHWNKHLGRVLRCRSCGDMPLSLDEVARIVEVLR